MNSMAHQNIEQGTLLVTGVGGQLGGRVASLLLQKGHKNIIGTTRKPEKVEHLKTQGLDVRTANFDQPELLEAAFRGADRMLLISTNKIGKRLNQHKNAITAAKAAGVRHILYTSIQNADRFKSIITAEHLETENFLKDSGLDYTILRNNLYADSLLMKTKPFIQWGRFAGCAGEGSIAYVTRENCAQVAVNCLLSPRGNQVCLDVTGAKAYTYAEVARLVAEISGKKIEYVNEPAEAFKGALQKFGLPEVMAQAMVDFDIMSQEGHLAQVNPAMAEVLGGAPTDAESFLNHQRNYLSN